MLIGIGHRRERGKSTAAAYLAKKHGFREVCFAGALKQAARAMFRLSEEQVDGPLKAVKDEFWGRTPRELLQLLGTEAGRKIFGEDIWIKAVHRQITEVNCPGIVIPDTRFYNEAIAVKDWGGILVRIDRNVPWHPDQDEHQSEKDLMYFNCWNYVIDNNSSFEELYAQLDEIIEGLKNDG